MKRMRRKRSRPCPSRQVFGCDNSPLLFEQNLSFSSQGILTLEATNGNVHVVKNEYKVGTREGARGQLISSGNAAIFGGDI